MVVNNISWKAYLQINSQTKNGEKLRESGKISNTYLRDLFNKNKLVLWDSQHMNLACIA